MSERCALSDRLMVAFGGLEPPHLLEMFDFESNASTIPPESLDIRYKKERIKCLVF